MTTVNQPTKTVYPKASNASQYAKKQSLQNLFSIEPNKASITDPFSLSTSYFPSRFHWIPEHGETTVQYYSDIWLHENSITIKAITDKTNTTKITYHNVFLNYFISEEMWGPNLVATRRLPKSPIPYSYHDYIIAWFRFMLHQNENMSHSWFVNFDKDFNSEFPLWFIRWWSQFSSSVEIFPAPLKDSFQNFTLRFRIDAHGAKFTPLFHFIKKYKVPWILKWQYAKESDVLTRCWFVKWWDKFPHTQSITNNVTRDFPFPSASPTLRITTLVQKAELANASASSFAKNVKPPVKPRKKSSICRK